MTKIAMRHCAEAPKKKLRHRLLACRPKRFRQSAAQSSALSPTAAAVGRSSSGTLRPEQQPEAIRIGSHRLAAEPIDKLSVYISLYAPDAVLGAPFVPSNVPDAAWDRAA